MSRTKGTKGTKGRYGIKVGRTLYRFSTTNGLPFENALRVARNLLRNGHAKQIGVVRLFGDRRRVATITAPKPEENFKRHSLRLGSHRPEESQNHRTPPRWWSRLARRCRIRGLGQGDIRDRQAGQGVSGQPVCTEASASKAYGHQAG